MLIVKCNSDDVMLDLKMAKLSRKAVSTISEGLKCETRNSYCT